MENIWAENEVSIYCKSIEVNNDDISNEYMKECAKTTLDAYNLLMLQGHSGCSIGITMSMLRKLVDGKPLTPIENTDDMWEPCFESEEFGYKSFICKRYYGLYKDVSDNGKVTYTDVKHWDCYDIGSNVPYSSVVVNNTLDEMFPITFPYTPHTYRVNCETFLYDELKGDFDHKAILNYIDAQGEKVDINKYFQETNKGWKEIPCEIYMEHKRISRHRNYCNKKET